MPKAINICAAEAGDIKELPANTVLISINEIEARADLSPLQINRDDYRVLTLRFPDITGKKTMHDGSVWYPMGDEIALKILDFINMHNGKNFIVHCAAGVSRSSAICLYLNLFHGYELKPAFWSLSNPNKFILGQLIVSRHMKRWKD